MAGLPTTHSASSSPRRCNAVISGATSSGKTSLLSSLLGLTEPGERIVLLEDTAELAPRSPITSSVWRPVRRATTALPAISVEQLLHTALRLRPDRLVVGEVRGREVLGLVQALNTGHDGSWSTCHANSALDALHRLETLVVQAAPAWPLRAVRDHLVRCIDVVVHVERTVGGTRRVVEIAEVIDRDGAPATRPIVIGDERVGQLCRSRARMAMSARQRSAPPRRPRSSSSCWPRRSPAASPAAACSSPVSVGDHGDRSDGAAPTSAPAADEVADVVRARCPGVAQRQLVAGGDRRRRGRPIRRWRA